MLRLSLFFFLSLCIFLIFLLSELRVHVCAENFDM